MNIPSIPHMSVRYKRGYKKDLFTADFGVDNPNISEIRYRMRQLRHQYRIQHFSTESNVVLYIPSHSR